MVTARTVTTPAFSSQLVLVKLEGFSTSTFMLVSHERLLLLRSFLFYDNRDAACASVTVRLMIPQELDRKVKAAGA